MLLDVLMPWVTWLGSGLITISLSGLIFFISHSRYLKETAKLSLIANVGGGLVTWILKFIVNRPRPPVSEIGFLDIFEGPSFPSGHATFVFATAIVFGWRYPRLRIPLLVLALVVAYSRIYLGEHFPLDVFAGAVIGSVAAAAALRQSQTDGG